MILTYHSGACIRAQAGDTTLVFAPVSKQSKDFKPTNFGADAAFVPLNHPDMNGSSASGFASGSKWGGEPRTNTIYYVHFDGLSLLYLGALSELDLHPDVLEMD